MKKKVKLLQRIGLVANFEKPASRAAVLRTSALIARTGRIVVAEQETARLAGLKCGTFAGVAELARAADLLLVFGGDGTMLHVTHDLNGIDTPILGINAGRLGFLTAVSSTDLGGALQRIWRNDFVIESRPLLEATGQCQEQSIRISALNDIVISHGAVSRVIELDVSVNDKELTCYRGDGLIVSSPTGSTAYSLSAGGPIISPSAAVFAITPICAHALSNHSVIVSLASTVRVQLRSEGMETLVSADGQLQATLGTGQAITIRRSRRSVKLMHLGGSSFFDTVRQKLHWSGSAV
ncbi:MAG TPA: NAD(+)/NADH kinase [Candidatus Saccharimonadales bacterium]|nr:NAD(+)/NADH kinase [Candidatus Saccharimonadales bacterium]